MEVLSAVRIVIKIGLLHAYNYMKTAMEWEIVNIHINMIILRKTYVITEFGNKFSNI